MNKDFNYGIDKLTVEKTIAIVSGKIKAVLGDEAIKKLRPVKSMLRRSLLTIKLFTGSTPVLEFYPTQKFPKKIQPHFSISY